MRRTYKLAENSGQGGCGRGAQPSRCGKRQSRARQRPVAESDHLPGGLRYRRNELDAAVAALDSAEAQLRQAVNAVGYATLKADKAGIVTAVTGEPGQVVGAGQTVISWPTSGETEIAVAVPEQDAAVV